MLYSSEDQEVL